MQLQSIRGRSSASGEKHPHQDTQQHGYLKSALDVTPELQEMIFFLNGKWQFTYIFFDQTILQTGEQNGVLLTERLRNRPLRSLHSEMLDRAPQHSDGMSPGRKRQHPGKREPPLDPRRPGLWRWNIAAAEKRVTGQRCGEDEVERTRFTQRHVRKVRSPVREPCGWDSRSENKGKDRQGRHLLWTEPWTDEEHRQRSPGMCSLT